jgi:tRNA A37 threonylcarbamoyladenosine synthetase subunit TsaC/SUA5/YrdC
VPEHQVLQELLALHGAPLLAATLIMPDEDLPLNDPEEIRERLEHQVGAVIDAGACSLEPTTVIDMSGDEPLLIRMGQGDPARIGL